MRRAGAARRDGADGDARVALPVRLAARLHRLPPGHRRGDGPEGLPARQDAGDAPAPRQVRGHALLAGAQLQGKPGRPARPAGGDLGGARRRPGPHLDRAGGQGPDHALRGEPAAQARRHAEAGPRPAAPDRRPARGPAGLRPADRRGRELRLQGHQGPALVRGADAPLLLGGQGGDAAQPDPDAEHRGAHQRLRRSADAADQRALPRPRRHARGGARRPLCRAPARHPADLPGLPADARASRACRRARCARCTTRAT